MKISKVHCLFEQSGSFKKAFKSIGIDAIDYDIEDQFGETDVKIDLFHEIEAAHEGQPSIFDHIKEDEMIMSFFPCTYFSVQNDLILNKTCYYFKTWDDEKIEAYVNERKEKREWMFNLLLKYINVCKTKNIKMIFENPYSNSYLLTREEIKQPDVVIQNRMIYGDDRVKPTGFWFFNMEPTFMSEFIQLNNAEKTWHQKTHGIERSLIQQDFAFNFINKYIMGVC